MRNYQRLIWVPNHNTQEQVLLRLCPDCGAVVGNEQAHDQWHEPGDVSEGGKCECGWTPRPSLIGGETLDEHQRWCSIHANIANLT